MPVLKVKRLTETATLPTNAYQGDGGWDLYSDEDAVLIPSGWVSTGIAVEIPNGYVGIVKERSSKAGKYNIGAGVIDSGYRGEVKVYVRANSSADLCGLSAVTIPIGEKIAQLLLIKLDAFSLEEVTELNESARGENGFGSSGV